MERNKSMITKSRERSRAKKTLNRNFTSGYIKTNEHYLNRVGLRGRKRWACLCLFIFIYLIAMAHLVLTCVILGVLRFKVTGPSSFVFQSNGDLLWSNGANITNVRLASPSSIRTYKEQSLGFHGNSSNEVIFQSTASRTASTSQMKLTNSSVNFEPSDSLAIFSGATGDQLLFVNSTYAHINGLTHLMGTHTTRTNTNRLQMRNSSSIESNKRVTLRGAAGVSLGSSQIDIMTSGNISLSAQTIIQLRGGAGVSFPAIPSISTSINQHSSHLCACTNGKLFTVPFNSLRCAAALNTPHILNQICT